MKKILLIILALLVLGGATFAGVYFVTSKNVEKEVVVEEAFYEIGEIFVNLSDTDSKRYVKLNMAISYDVTNKDLATELETKKVVLRDTAIYYLKSCVAESFNTENEVKLKKDIIQSLNKNLTKGTLIDVYISEIMVQ
ncbi:MAG: flagellar basal body-associated FliL family protein [Clostridium sp.]